MLILLLICFTFADIFDTFANTFATFADTFDTFADTFDTVTKTLDTCVDTCVYYGRSANLKGADASVNTSAKGTG